jgi:flagellar motor switch protein FliN/FliY
MSDFSNASFHRFGAVAVRLSVELGRTEMCLRDVLQLGEGSTVTLDRLTDELLDVTANGRVIARGEVVAEKGRFGLRIVTLEGDDGQDVVSAPAPETAPAPMPASAPADPVVSADDML